MRRSVGWGAMVAGLALLPLSAVSQINDPVTPPIPADYDRAPDPHALSPRIYWVQVGSFPDDARAEELLADVESRGVSPVCIYRSGLNRTVRVGEFPTMADAQLAVYDLEDLGYSDLRIRYNSLEEEAAEGRTWAFQPYVVESEPNVLFHLSDRPFSTEGCVFDHDACALDEGGIRNENRLVAQDVAAQVEVEANETNDAAASDADPLRGAAYLALADLDARRGLIDAAQELVLPVADGRYGASPQTRWDAMWLAARLFHNEGNRRTAYRAYREIETLCTNPSDLGRCLYEQAGLLVELSRSGLGRISESRLVLDDLLARVPEVPGIQHELRAKAMLLHAETLLDDGRADEALQQFDNVIAEAADCPLQVGLARLFRGHIYANRGRLDPNNLAIAEECFAALETDLGAWDDPLRSGILRRRAMMGRFDVALLRRDEARMTDVAEELAERWPESPEANNASLALETRGMPAPLRAPRPAPFADPEAE